MATTAINIIKTYLNALEVCAKIVVYLFNCDFRLNVCSAQQNQCLQSIIVTCG